MLPVYVKSPPGFSWTDLVNTFFRSWTFCSPLHRCSSGNGQAPVRQAAAVRYRGTWFILEFQVVLERRKGIVRPPVVLEFLIFCFKAVTVLRLPGLQLFKKCFFFFRLSFSGGLGVELL